MDYVNIFFGSIKGTAQWVLDSMLMSDHIPWYKNYFYGLILISLLVWGLEVLFPWRKQQSVIRKDFWLDGMYMFFNFFVFSIAISGFYTVIEHALSQWGFTMQSIALLPLQQWPAGVSLLVFFVLNDFVQWFTHVQLHRFPALWKFHQVHHSVEEMGFAAHLRYHWMENLFYKPLKTLIVMLVGGFEPEQAFALHFIAILIGHLNHANVRITWGPLKYLINNSVMHLYHHAKDLPKGQMPGVNFGISLSCWDYLFGTNYIPQDKDGSYALGFDGVETFPQHFGEQLVHGIVPDKNQKK